MTVSGASTNAQFLRVGQICFVTMSVVCTLGGSASNTITVSLPVPPVGLAVYVFSSYGLPPGANWQNLISNLGVSTVSVQLVSVQLVSVQLASFANYALGSITFYVTGSYRCS